MNSIVLWCYYYNYCCEGLQKHCSRLSNAGYCSLMLQMHSCLINDIQYYKTYLTVDENSTKWLEPEKSEVDQANVTTINRPPLKEACGIWLRCCSHQFCDVRLPCMPEKLLVYRLNVSIGLSSPTVCPLACDRIVQKMGWNSIINYAIPSQRVQQKSIH